MSDSRTRRALSAERGGGSGAGNAGGGDALAVNLLAPELLRDPYPTFARLRERDPVHWSERSRAWLLTRYDDIVDLLHDARLSADRVTGFFTAGLAPHDRDVMAPTFETLSRWMVFRDPPDHTRLRGLVRQAFSARAMATLRDRVQHVVGGLLDAAEDDGRPDLMASFARPLPAIVIGELLGVPAGDKDLFRAWSAELSTLLFGALDDPDRYQRGHQALLELIAYFEALIEQRRARPANDVVSALVDAEARHGALRRDDVLATCALLVFAGHATTTDLIGNGLLALLRHPDQRRLLEGDASLLPRGVEELLRFDGPGKLTIRSVKERLEVHGRSLEPGQRVLLAVASANRDPGRFDDPDRLDISRRDNRHLGFGTGIHHCLGAPLARLETGIAIPALLRRFPRLQLTDEPLEWLPLTLSRSLRALPVSVR